MPDNTEIVTEDTVDVETDVENGAEDASDNTTEEQESQESPEIQELGRAIGWVPKEDFVGDENEWVSASDFIKNAGLVARKQKITNHRLEQTIEEMRRDVKKTLEYQNSIAAKEIQRLKDELNAAKEDAIKEGDVESVKKIDAQLDDLEEKEESGSADQLPPEYEEWHKNNPWYGGTSTEDKRLTRIAEAIAAEYEGSNMTPKQVYDEIDKEIAEIRNMKKKTQEKPKTRVSDVAGAGGKLRTTGDKQRFTINDLTFEQRTVAKNMVAKGFFKNEQEYVDSLAASINGGK